MPSSRTKPVRVFAPAKLNLYLHVTGRRDDGYHTLDSLVAFADIGDHIVIEKAVDFALNIDGPFAVDFSAKERDSSPSSSNLVVQAAWALSRQVKKPLNVRIHLTKNLPMGAGIGGGSSDAAAVIWGLLEWWGLDKDIVAYRDLMADLGADIPVSFLCETARMRGIGEILDTPPVLPEVPIVLVYPSAPCPTQKVFMQYAGDFKDEASLPDAFEDGEALIAFLKTCENNLYDAARRIVPAVTDVMRCLDDQKTCRFVRMTGSGSSCFGIFDDLDAAKTAAQTIQDANPEWWVQAGWLGRSGRY